MQESVIYKFIKKFGYPFIVRHDRLHLYRQNPNLDYAHLLKNTLFASTAGYFVGSFFKIGFRLAFLSSLPLWIKFVYDQYQLKLQGLYQKIYFAQNIQIKQTIVKIREENIVKQQKKQKLQQIQQKINLKHMDFPQKSFTSVKNFVNQLPLSYFK